MGLQWEDQNLQPHQELISKFINKLHYTKYYILQRFESDLLMTFVPFLALLLPVTHCAGHNSDLPSNSNISKSVRANTVFIQRFLNGYLISFLLIPRLIGFSLIILKLSMFKVYGIIRISKIEFFIFSRTERVTRNLLEILFHHINLHLNNNFALEEENIDVFLTIYWSKVIKRSMYWYIRILRVLTSTFITPLTTKQGVKKV